MPFIGKNPTAGFATIVKDDFTADGTTTVFTLSKQVATVTDIAVYVGNVRQEPTDAYTVNGTTLTMSAAPATGVNFYVLHIAGTIESSVVPPDGSIGTAKLVNNAVTSAKLDTNIAVTGTLTAVGDMQTSGEFKANGGAVFNEDSANVDFRVESNDDANMLKVDGANNRVGIGTSSPTTALTLGTSQTATVQNGGSTSAPAYAIVSGAIGVNGTYVPAANTLGFVVGGAERGRFTANGLTFNGDTAAANALDDYEEGTFTPTMSTASSYAAQLGFYTKVGRIVHCQITLQWVNSGTSTGSLGGLPFTVFGQNYATIMSREWYATGETWNANLNVGATGTYGFTYGNNQSTVSNGSTYGLGLTFVYRVS